MKQLLLLGLLLTGLIGCHKDSPTPADDLLGHWQADTVEYTTTTPSGTVVNTFSTNYVQTLDVTATILTYSHPAIVGGATPVPVSFTYTRSGEDLAMTSGTWLGIETHVRTLTPTSFTYEEKTGSAGGGFTITRMPYHR